MPSRGCSLVVEHSAPISFTELASCCADCNKEPTGAAATAAFIVTRSCAPPGVGNNIGGIIKKSPADSSCHGDLQELPSQASLVQSNVGALASGALQFRREYDSGHTYALHTGGWQAASVLGLRKLLTVKKALLSVCIACCQDRTLLMDKSPAIHFAAHLCCLDCLHNYRR